MTSLTQSTLASLQKKVFLVSGMIQEFDTRIASKCGVVGAVIIQDFAKMIEKCELADVQTHEGRYWVCCTVEEIASWYSYLSYSQVRRTIDKLVSKGLLIKDNFNIDKFDRTSWYSFTDKAVRELAESGYFNFTHWLKESDK